MNEMHTISENWETLENRDEEMNERRKRLEILWKRIQETPEDQRANAIFLQEFVPCSNSDKFFTQFVALRENSSEGDNPWIEWCRKQFGNNSIPTT